MSSLHVFSTPTLHARPNPTPLSLTDVSPRAAAQLLVEQRTVGTANGVATSVQMFGIGCCNIIVGYLKDNYSWSVVLYFFTGMGALSFLLTVAMHCVDDGILWEGKRDREARAAKLLVLDDGDDNRKGLASPLLAD